MYGSNRPCNTTYPDSAFITPGYSFTRCSSYTSATNWSYDAAGNKTDNSGTYGTGNRVTTYKGYTFEHDNDGNVTRKYKSGFDVRYGWDELGRLTKVVNDVTHDSLEYAYDAGDRLIRRKKNGTAQRYFLWDGDNIATEFLGNMNSLVSYAYEGIDSPIMASQDYYTPTAIIHADGIGNMASYTTYDAWGVPELNWQYMQSYFVLT